MSSRTGSNTIHTKPVAPMTAAEVSFLESVAAAPGDDVIRLAYADWLDEQDTPRLVCPHCGGPDYRGLRCHRCRGQVTDTHEHHSGEDYDGTWFCDRSAECPLCDGAGSIVDDGAARRSEFIRLQVELADSVAAWFADYHSSRGVDAGAAGPIYAKQRRVQTILELDVVRRRAVTCQTCGGNGRRPASQPTNYQAGCAACAATGDAGGLTWTRPVMDEYGAHRADTPTATAVKYRRGFPDTIDCALLRDVADLVRVNPSIPSGLTEWDAAMAYRPTPWARAVVRYHPVVRFVPADRVPALRYQLGEVRQYAWNRAVPGLPVEDHTDWLPGGVIDLMPTTAFDTEEAARDAAAPALASWVRSFPPEV